MSEFQNSELDVAIPELRTGLTTDLFMEAVLGLIPVPPKLKNGQLSVLKVKLLEFGAQIGIPEGTLVQNLANGKRLQTTRELFGRFIMPTLGYSHIGIDPRQVFNGDEVKIKEYEDTLRLTPSNHPESKPSLDLPIDSNRIWITDTLPVMVYTIKTD